MNLDPSSVLDFGNYNTAKYYYSTQTDGIKITNSSGSLNLKLLGTTNTAIFNNSNASFTSLDIYSSANGQSVLYGTNMADNIVVTHSDCYVNGDGNYLNGDYGTDTIITTGNDGYNTYIMSTGLVGVDGSAVNAAPYNPNFNDTVTVTITDGVVISSTSGTIPPAGVFTNGDYLVVSSSFVGNLIMSSTGANYTNDQIVTMDATQNYQVVMQFGGNSNGNDAVFGSDYTDVIHLHDVNVSDIVSYAYDANRIALGLNSGNVISVARNS